MNPVILQCAICGWYIFDNDYVSWKNQFRGLCSSREEGVYVTGVGLYTNRPSGLFIAPRNPDARWNDAGYKSPVEDKFGVLAQDEINGKRGFVFHDACWSLVKEGYHPAPIPFARLFEVLDSLCKTYPRLTLDWGHDYGGLVLFQDEIQKDFFPWEYPGFRRIYFEDDVDTLYDVNPLASYEVQGILAGPPQVPPSRASLPFARSSSSGRDPFTSLPEELCSAIATYLPTPDVLNARRASRSFWLVFDSQQFWASRFKGKASERSWVFEAAHGLEAPGGVRGRDWRGLYRRTVDARLTKGTQNRKRVWGLILHMADIVALSWNELPREVPFPWQIPTLPEQESPKAPWILAAGCIRGWDLDYSQIPRACARLKIQRVAIPTDGISQVAVSTVYLGREGYIAGMSLTATNGEVIQLGYKATGSEHSVQLEGSILTGFNLAVGRGGIQALQCVSNSDTARQLSTWLGFPHDVPITERLSRVTITGQTMVLELGFDGFRMVSLAICRQPRQHMPTSLGADDDSGNARNSALWYPHPPPPSLNLNEDFLLVPDLYTSGYRPLFWTWFGGPGGSFLASLVNIRFICTLGRIEFMFNRSDVPTECQSFGRIYVQGPSDSKSENEHDKFYKPSDFSIDGPGGETIHKIEVCHRGIKGDWRCREGHLAWLKIHTNRGRMWEVGRKPKASSKSSVKREFSVAPGDAITGFYGVQYRYLGFNIASIGMITEPILRT